MPLCVELSAVLKSDPLHEQLVHLLRHDPIGLAAVAAELRHGASAFRRAVADRTADGVSWAEVGFRAEVVEHLHELRASGRTLLLVTAHDRRAADAVAAAVGVFDRVVTAEQLRAEFGEGGYAYVGQVPSGDRRPGRLKTWVKALRCHQWVKNVLVYVPVVCGHRYTDPAAVGLSAAFFVAFSLTASGLYLFNDLFDLPADRRHPTKRRRPFAAGDLSLASGLLVAPLLIAVGAGVGFAVNLWCGLILLGYAGVTQLYSARLKRVPLADVFVLSGLYMVRVIGGGAASGVELSEWLLAFSGFFFLSLAFLKRAIELGKLTDRQEQHAAGRGYTVADRPMVQTLGVASGFAAAVVLALYVNSPMAKALYPTPQALWGVVPTVLFVICRAWLLCSRGVLHDDPIVFALTDRMNWAAAVTLVGCLGAARIGVR